MEEALDLSFDRLMMMMMMMNDLLLHKLRIPELEIYCEQCNGQKRITASYAECGVKW